MTGTPSVPKPEESLDTERVASLLLELSTTFGSHHQAALPIHLSDQRESHETALEDDLPTMEARYRVLLEQIPAVVFMAFIAGGMSEAYVSPQIERMLGFSREEWLDDPIRWYHQIHPDDRARWSVEAATMFASGKPLKSVYRVFARDGRVVWFHCEAKLVRRKDGQPWFIHGVGFDITELKCTEQALQKESAERERLQKLELDRQIARTEQMEARLAAIVESSEDAIISKDLDGIITTWNPAATRLFGYEPWEVLGKSVLLLIPVERHAEEMQILRSLRAGERIEHLESERKAKSGKRLDVSLTISPIMDRNGEVIGASSILRDITEQKHLEEKLQVAEKLAATGRLAATIAHEVNNPLEAITNLLYLARNDSGAGQSARSGISRDGNFEFNYVPEGSFIVRAAANSLTLEEIKNIRHSSNAIAIDATGKNDVETTTGKFAELGVIVNGDVSGLSLALPDPPALAASGNN